MVVGTLVLALVLGWNVPGPQRLMCPSCFGLKEVAPRLYVDAAAGERDTRRLQAMVRQARRRVAEFFGPLRADPIVVACLTSQCVKLFGDDKASAVAYGWYAIKLLPSGQSVAVAAHELAHAELHRRVGLGGFIRTSVPMWFDEGLAVLVSEERRRARSVSRAERTAVVAARTYAEWHAHVARVGSGRAYRAALGVVSRIDRRIGRARFRAFVQRLEEGASFDDVVAEFGVRPGA